MWVPHSLTGQHLVGSQEVANVCSLSATSLRWSRAFLITAALVIPRADSLSLGHVVMEVLKLQRRHQRHCPSPRQTRSALDSLWLSSALWSKLNLALHPVELQKAWRPCKL